MSNRSCVAFFVSYNSPCIFVNLSSWFRLLARPANVLMNPASSAESRATTLAFLAACLSQVLGRRPASFALDSIKNRSVSESRTISCAFLLTFLGGRPPLDLCDFCSMLSISFISFTESVKCLLRPSGVKASLSSGAAGTSFCEAKTQTCSLLPERNLKTQPSGFSGTVLMLGLLFQLLACYQHLIQILVIFIDT